MPEWIADIGKRICADHPNHTCIFISEHEAHCANASTVTSTSSMLSEPQGTCFAGLPDAYESCAKVLGRVPAELCLTECNGLHCKLADISEQHCASERRSRLDTTDL